MGWDSASNEIEQATLHLRSATKEEAIRIAVRNGEDMQKMFSFTSRRVGMWLSNSWARVGVRSVAVAR